VARRPQDGSTKRDDAPTGNAAAWTTACESWYATYAKEVWAAAYARCLDRDLAYDMTQECFLRAWQHLEKGEELTQPRAWLLRVVRNMAEDTARSAFRRHGTQAPDTMGGVYDRGDGPAAILIERESFAKVRAVLQELEPPDRELLTMKYALDYDAAKIAAILEVPLTAVHMRLSRARKRLGDKLAGSGVDES